MTLYKNDHDNEIVNTSSNRPFADVLSKAVERRQVVVGGLTAATATFFAQSSLAKTIMDQTKDTPKMCDHIGFTPVAVADGNGPVPTISADYQYEVFIPWGTPIEPSGPAYSYPPNAKDQAKQVGIGHDGMAYFPIDEMDNDKHSKRGKWRRRGNNHGLLAINHEFGRNTTVLAKEAPESLDDVRASQHAHGVSVLEIKKDHSGWKTVESDKARRIHANTPVTYSGPVAGHALLQTPNGNIPLGTVNNCSSGPTPWGTYLTCEENFNLYFGASNIETAWEPTAAQERYGFSEEGGGYSWYMFDRRFDLSDPDYKNEENRFGWVVEINPYDATQMPVKRTALGRVKHEGATTVIGKDGRAVVYMGDDQRFDYIYKFVSARDHKEMLEEGVSPLDEGDLYVAKFNDDGSGEWLKLTIDDPVLAENFNDQGEVLVYTRLAADLLGATPMDRPEWTTVAPNGDVYCTLTNNSRRETTNAANPMAPNENGHIVRWHDTNHHVGEEFQWDIFLIADDTHGSEESFASPDGLWADPDGRLFIQTDGGQADGLNNQMLVADTVTGKVTRLLTGVTDDEITGITVTPDRRTMFVNIQHPGNGDPTVTNFPAETDGVTVPRDCTLIITRKDGGIVGS